MTLDWMDFCVEHLSKWWGGLLYQRGMKFDSANLLEHVVGMLRAYMFHKVQPPSENTPLSQTIAMVAFAPYGRKMNANQSYLLTTHSLAATIASLYQVGFGRVSVVGINADDVEFVKGAVDILELAYNNKNHDNTLFNATKGLGTTTTLAKLGSIEMEVAFN
ncbi:MAG: hypothetical protein SGARI_003417 [Bacillariaceae sp.]